jgi:hypothetical protein
MIDTIFLIMFLVVASMILISAFTNAGRRLTREEWEEVWDSESEKRTSVRHSDLINNIHYRSPFDD